MIKIIFTSKQIVDSTEFIFTTNKVTSTCQSTYDKLVHVIQTCHRVGHFKCFQTLAMASTINDEP